MQRRSLLFGLRAAQPRLPSRSGLAPFVPTPEAPWNVRRALHLLRRTGFGATLADAQQLLAGSPSDAVDALVDAALTAPLPTPPAWAETPPPPGTAPQAEKQEFSRNNLRWTAEYERTYLGHLSTGGLRDKLALCWQNHVVTAIDSYSLAAYAHQYLTLLRRHALGNFETLIREVGLLPAMLFYLDGNKNTASSPNENYARELMELFTIGIGNYTDADIRELARALTGWQVRDTQLAAEFKPNLFDTGNKTLFGQTGAYDYQSAHDVLFTVKRGEIATFVARRLYTYFIASPADEAVVAELAAALLASNLEIAPVVRQLLKSEAFFADTVVGALYKSPVEYLLGLVRSLGFTLNDNLIERLRVECVTLKQALFNPPNVAGWPRHRAWLTTDTLPRRWTFVESLLSTIDGLTVLARTFSAPNDPYALSRDFATALLAVPLSSEAEATLADVLLAGIPDYEWSVDAPGAESNLRGLVRYLTSLPEYQLT